MSGLSRPPDINCSFCAAAAVLVRALAHSYLWIDLELNDGIRFVLFHAVLASPAWCIKYRRKSLLQHSSSESFPVGRDLSFSGLADGTICLFGVAALFASCELKYSPKHEGVALQELVPACITQYSWISGLLSN
jgi:hypothetical protein